MIRNQWYIIATSKEIRTEKPTRMVRLGQALVLWRNPDLSLACLADRCPHRGASLSKGKNKGKCVQCPFHGFEFDASGRCRHIPANGHALEPPKAMHALSYNVREAHGWIYLWLGDALEEYPPLPWIHTIDETKFACTVFTSLWHAHYSRAIENQLDVMHLPFVHSNTIGSGGQTLVNGPFYEWETPDLLNIWVNNELDHNQIPLSPSKMQKTGKPMLQFHMPNLWQNWLSDDFRIFAAFVPIESEYTRIYLATYQRFIPAPILRDIFAILSNLGNRVILRQDQRVVETQRPYQVNLRSNEEILIQGDGPIIAYRRRCEEFMEKI